MIKTPWFSDSVPFNEAAEIGTEKVIKDHATIGIVITTDGSFGEIPRKNYVEVEEKIINELKELGKPFIVLLNTKNKNSSSVKTLQSNLRDAYDVPIIPINVLEMEEDEILDVLKEALYEFPVMDIKVNIPKWVYVLDNEHYIKKHYLEKIKESVISVNKLRDVDNILTSFKDSEIISNSYISKVDTETGNITINLESSNDLYKEVLKELVGDMVTTKAGLLKIFASYKDSKEELDSIKEALKMAKNTGYGIVYPTLKDMTLSTPEIIKQGTRYGIKLKANACSIHLMKVNVESTFEPIIGSELQSKELINYLMKDYETDPNSIWKSEIFGRSIDSIVKEGIQAKLSVMPDAIRYKLSQTVTKIVNKGSSNLITIVI
jgi:stage IV sporulation protein A